MARLVTADSLGSFVRSVARGAVAGQRRTSVLGIDHGGRSVGVAITDAKTLIARPLETLDQRGLGSVSAVATGLRRIALEHGVVGVVLGWPLELTGHAGVACARVERFAHDLAAEGIHLPVVLWDERMSTLSAIAELEEQDSLPRGAPRRRSGGAPPKGTLRRRLALQRRGRGAEIDAIAATHILQGWVDAHLREWGESRHA